MQIKQREQESTTNNYEIQIQKNNLTYTVDLLNPQIFGKNDFTYTVDFSFHKSEANSKLRTNIAIMYIGYQTFWSIPFATPRHHVVIMS